VSSERILRRLDRAEAAIAKLARHELDFDVARYLSFSEIEHGQRALRAYGGDPSKALDAGDPAFLALVAAAHARRAGVRVAELFP
jgi:hypothetical protein